MRAVVPACAPLPSGARRIASLTDDTRAPRIPKIQSFTCLNTRACLADLYTTPSPPPPPQANLLGAWVLVGWRRRDIIAASSCSRPTTTPPPKKPDAAETYSSQQPAGKMAPSTTTASTTSGGRRGTLTLTVRGARNVKAPTPELLGGRAIPRPLRDCVLVAEAAAAAAPSWESMPRPALDVVHVWNETTVFEGVAWCVSPKRRVPLL
jgi:hypothetical protein